MKRRTFLKTSAAVVAGTPMQVLCSDIDSLSRSTVIHATETDLYAADESRILDILGQAIQTLMKTDSAEQAWRFLFDPSEIIGIKVNCLSGYGSTHVQLVAAVCEHLQLAGIPAKNIIIWDRFSSDLEDGGFRIKTAPSGIRCFGNERSGFEADFEIYNSAASLVCRTLSQGCDAVINLPVLRDHGIAGVTMALKNMFGAIHNPNKYHLTVGDPYIADVYMLPSIRKKVRLHICDALSAQYEGGPSYMPHWRWNENSLLVSRDPVALDYYGWQMIEKQRKLNNLPALATVNRKPTYIATAADGRHNLGTNDPERIDVVKI